MVSADSRVDVNVPECMAGRCCGEHDGGMRTAFSSCVVSSFRWPCRRRSCSSSSSEEEMEEGGDVNHYSSTGSSASPFAHSRAGNRSRRGDVVKVEAVRGNDEEEEEEGSEGEGEGEGMEVALVSPHRQQQLQQMIEADRSGRRMQLPRGVRLEKSCRKQVGRVADLGINVEGMEEGGYDLGNCPASVTVETCTVVQKKPDGGELRMEQSIITEDIYPDAIDPEQIALLMAQGFKLITPPKPQQRAVNGQRRAAITGAKGGRRGQGRGQPKAVEWTEGGDEVRGGEEGEMTVEETIQRRGKKRELDQLMNGGSETKKKKLFHSIH